MLTIPALTGMADKARSAESQSNLRQIGALLYTYAADNNGCFPTARSTLRFNPNWQSVDERRRSWQMQLIPYFITIDISNMTIEEAESSPLFKIFRSRHAAQYWNNAKVWGYFLGSHAAGVQAQEDTGDIFAQALIAHKIRYPSKHILAGETFAGPFELYDSDRDDYAGNNPAFRGGANQPNVKVNILFADGHVGSYPRDLRELKKHDPNFDPNEEFSVTYEGPDSPYPSYFDN